MRKILLILAALLPAPAMAAELWCMPETICRADGSCKSTMDEETSLRLADMDADATTMRVHAETIPMARTQGQGVVEWAGTNTGGGAEYVIWTQADNAFTYTETHPSGDLWKATGYCEVQ